MILFDQNWVSTYYPQYIYISTITSGGQKDVCLVRDAKGEQFVIKVVNPQCDRERIQREIDTVKNYSFRRVPKIIDFKEIRYGDNNLLSIVEQYITGSNLRTILLKTRLDPNLVKSIVYQLLLIVVELEQKQVVHRDIKPENVILDSNNQVWLIDFGIALDFSRTALTDPSAKFALCTYGYAAPEQIHNMKAIISSKADLFSIGVMAYELLTQSHPFREGAHGILDVIQRTESCRVPPIPPNLNVPSDLESFIRWLFKRHPSQRPESAALALSYFEQLFPEVKQ